MLIVCHPWHDSEVSLFVISPGRFFAANELKVLLAHLVVTYDMQFEEGKGAPRALSIATMSIPKTTDVMFRTRQK